MSIERMRKKVLSKDTLGTPNAVDVKEGRGGIRDIEFVVQGLQLIHASKTAALIKGNTLCALSELRSQGVLPSLVVEEMSADYLFLRRIEHFLQIFEDRQIRALPRDAMQLSTFARRILGPSGTSERLLKMVEDTVMRVKDYYFSLLREYTEKTNNTYSS